MKRNFWIGLAIILLGAALLIVRGGQKEQWITGLVTELQTGDSGELTAFVVRTGSGEELGILLTGKTAVFPKGDSFGIPEELSAAFQTALRPDVQVRAVCTHWKKKLTTGGGAQVTAYEANHIQVTGQMDRGAVTMKDGTPIDVLEDRSGRSYLLADGTELLRVTLPSGPENNYVGGLESFDDLGAAAQARVLDYYERRGLLYDERAELERAYALYREPGAGFSAAWINQGVTPSASNGRVMYFRTDVTLPMGEENGQLVYDVTIGDAFDRETGAHIDTWELFTVPREDVIKALLDKAGIQEQPLRAEMEAALWDGRVVFTSDGLSVTFEPGVLPSQEHSTGFSVDYADAAGLIQDWALPKGREQAQPGTQRS